MRLNAKETATILGVSFKTVYRWVQQNKIPHRKLNDQIYFSRYDITAWASQQRLSVHHDHHMDDREKVLVRTPLSVSLRSGGIHYRLDGETVADVLGEVSGHCGLTNPCDRLYLRDALIAREKMGSTAVAGIALPHPRTPLFDLVDSPRVSLFFLERPVDFEACDLKPVNILFVVLAPFIRSHLNLLSQVATLLSESTTRKALEQVPSRESVYKLVETHENSFSVLCACTEKNSL